MELKKFENWEEPVNEGLDALDDFVKIYKKTLKKYKIKKLAELEGKTKDEVLDYMDELATKALDKKETKKED